MVRIILRRRTRRVRARRSAALRPARARARRPSKVRALIGCADLRLVGKLLKALAGSSRVEAVGVATTPAEAAEQAAALRPDVAVFDVDLGGEMRGINTGLALRKSGSVPGLVMLSPENERQRLKAMPPGMGSEWSCLFTESATEADGLAYAAQCAAWSIPVVDPKLGQIGPGARPPRRSLPKASDAHKARWRGAVQRFSASGATGPAPPSEAPELHERPGEHWA